MQKVITTLKDILTPLSKNPKDIWDNEDWQHIYAEWPPLSCENIDGLFSGLKTESVPLVVDFLEFQRGAVLYLPPLEKDPDCVPILSLFCKLKETQSVAKLKVMLVKLDEKQKPDGIYGIGFRMETPESFNQDDSSSTNDQNLRTDNACGIHDFHHAQLIRTLGQSKLDDKLKIDCPVWIPQSQPSFPLPVECPVTLLLCVIITLYGRKYYEQFLIDHEIFEIEQYKGELKRWINQ